MKRQHRQGIAPHTPFCPTLAAPQRKNWSEMSRDERIAWIEEMCTWLTDKRRREQKYLDRRQKDMKTDRDYRADAIRELDMLAMLSELAEEIQAGLKGHGMDQIFPENQKNGFLP